MRRSSSAALVSALVAVVLASTTLPAEAFGHRHTFASPSPSYKRTDSNGTFTAQVSARWTSSSAVTVPWAFTVAPQVRAIAAGRMTCKAGHMQLPYTDHHRNIAVTYTWHSSVPKNARNKNYDLWGHCAFPVKVGGKTGMANLRFTFAYKVSGPAKRSATAAGVEQGGPEFTSELTIS
ncbi:hypothetical protein NLX83_33960 [Allokutzneria sp. A3M-2-11 16]|uniref:hypothetical protein n=1 Tax=Allokutzneria sp. A3M-2-11 16 TaxID=2962043 RepID=UPI0020B834CD|nr:hypothetical protein [Allokutzneria sp. A3M-2-11 16]MCP3804286.1 hypothetical protein [Allokutzneria sp. A3M-2-11 16]